MIDPGRLAELPCFAEFSDEERARASDRFQEIDVPAGAEVAVQGDFAYEFFVVEDGTAEVRENGICVTELGRGDFFGELGLMVTGRRTASVVSTSPMRLFALFDQDFRRLEHELPHFAQGLRDACGERFRRAP
jgi:CRP/FNR family transcriptional regulator, cyclic AMP receptor protein